MSLCPKLKKVIDIQYNCKDLIVILILQDCNRNLAFIPSGYISMTDALRQPYSLTVRVRYKIKILKKPSMKNNSHRVNSKLNKRFSFFILLNYEYFSTGFREPEKDSCLWR